METGEQDGTKSTGDLHRSTVRWNDTFGLRGDARFRDTRWSLVAMARSGTDSEMAEAMGELCRGYWYPLYAYVRRSGKSREEAEDLTQEFFSRYLLEQGLLAKADQDKGKLRTFLLTVMKRFLIKDWQKGRAEKRGGGREHLSIDFEEGEERYGHEPVDRSTPDEVYEKQWAVTLLGRVMESLRRDYVSRGMEKRYEVLQEALWWNSADASYAELGQQLEMKENAVKQAVSRMRKQYRRMLKDEIRSTLDLPEEDEEAVDSELRYLVNTLRQT